MSSAIQQRADAANDSYANRSQNDVARKTDVSLDGQKYRIFGYANDPVSGFHATAYKEVAPPHNVIIAYRGTDPGLFSGKTSAEKMGHALTTMQDIAVDATMVRDAVNPQRDAADAFTQAMIDKAARQGISKDHVFVAGHSLGGTLAEIEAAKFGLAGSTYNAYGAVGLVDGLPQRGTDLINYRMAGDVVSAANAHIGEVVSLASKEDVLSLRDGRYLDAPTGAPPPNALIAMRLGDHGGEQHFSSQSADNVLEPSHFREAAQRYADHKVGFDHFARDVLRERAELSQALKHLQEHHRLPSDIQRQVDEYLVLHADQPVRDAIEHGVVVEGAEHTLQQGADLARGVGHSVQLQDERAAAAAREAGAYAAPLGPFAPLAGLALSEAAHLHGEVADAMGHFAGDRLQSARGGVEQGVHNVAQGVVGAMHTPAAQGMAASIVNHMIDSYHDDQTIGRAVVHAYESTRHTISQSVGSAERAAVRTYDATRQTVSHGVDAAERAADQAYETLSHPGRWFHHDAPNAAAGSAVPRAEPATSVDLDGSRHDPRHAESPYHPLYQQLKARIPQAGEHRLLQFTAACHQHGITAHNLGKITYLEEQGLMQFRAHLDPRSPVTVDVRAPSPAPQESIAQMHQTDAWQAQRNLQVAAQQQEPMANGLGR